VEAIAMSREDDDTLVEHYCRFRRQLLAKAQQIGLSTWDAEDTVQEVFTRLLVKSRREAKRSAIRSPENYLSIAVRYAGLDAMRRLRRDRALANNWFAPRAPAAPLSGRSGPEYRVLAGEAAAVIATAMSRLTQRQKVALILYWQHDLSVKGIASRMGCSPKTAENHLRAAFNRLRRSEELRNYYAECTGR
jgi:RNA polymerase sigma-70 factor, ECF subfamily